MPVFSLNIDEVIRKINELSTSQKDELLKEIKAIRKTAKIYLVIGVIASGVFGYFLNRLISFLTGPR